MPTTATTVAAQIAFLLPWPRHVMNLLFDEAPGYLRFSEPQEFYVVLTLALYARSIAVRLGREDAPPVRDGGGGLRGIGEHT
jgi:hypothetical protein